MESKRVLALNDIETKELDSLLQQPVSKEEITKWFEGKLQEAYDLGVHHRLGELRR